MNPNPAAPSPEPTEAEIQHTAYLLWLESGKLPGRDQENWFAARELLRHRHAPAAGHKRGAVSPIPPAIPVTPVPAAKKR
jgi:hypothetical protein